MTNLWNQLSLKGKISALTAPITYYPKAFFYVLKNKANQKASIILAVLRQEYRIHWLRDA